MSFIKPGLFIGNFRDAQDINFLQRNGITHVLCSAAELFPVFPGRFEYKHVRANDVPSYQLSRHFDQGADFIHEGVKNGGNVFVHCAAGISRSVSLALAYLMKHDNLKLSEAFNLIKNKRYIANPNPGFVKQLKDFELRIFSARERERQQNDFKLQTASKQMSPTATRQIFTQEEAINIAPNYPLNDKSWINSPQQPQNFQQKPQTFGTTAPGFYNALNMRQPSFMPPLQKDEKSQPKIEHKPVPLNTTDLRATSTSQLSRGTGQLQLNSRPMKQQEAAMKQLRETSSHPQVDFRLTGISVGNKAIPKPKTPITKPPILYNDKPQATDLRNVKPDRSRSNAPTQSAELYNRYLKMTLPYQEPRIATYNQRTNTQNLLPYPGNQTLQGFRPQGLGYRNSHQPDDNQRIYTQAFSGPGIAIGGLRTSVRSGFYY